jgi:superfamily II DNA or RNA helicase
MEQIVISKLNESFLQISCESSTERELSEHFCFYVPGYKFMPAYRNRVWDGKIRLFDYRKKQIYCGLFNYLKEFAQERGYKIITDYEPTSTENVDELISRLPLTAAGAPIHPRGYQIEGIKHALSNNKSLLLSPTASGKSLMIYLMIRHFLESNDKQNILIVVPTTSLVEQMYTDFGDYSSTDSWNVDNNCHRIYSGKEKINLKHRVIITTWQSVYKMNLSWFNSYGMVIGDEAHNFKAKSLTAILEKCVNAKYRIGTTGTLDGTQTHQLVLEGLFGPVHRVTSTKSLMDADDLAQLEIRILLLKYADRYMRSIAKAKYQEELDFLVGHSPRNEFITDLTVKLRGNVLVLFQYVEKHGKPLHDILKKKVAKNQKLFYVSGETDVDTRENIRSITENENNAIIVASMGTFSTGINIKKLHNIIFASPSKSQIRVLQSIGRGLRKSGDGINTIVYDIADDLHWRTQKNYTLKHAAERINIYSKEKFTYNINEINL